MALNTSSTGELLNPEEEIPLGLVRKHLDTNSPEEGFAEIKQLAEREGWEVQVIPNDRRDRNVARFVASEKVIKIFLKDIPNPDFYGNLLTKSRLATCRSGSETNPNFSELIKQNRQSLKSPI